MRRAMPLLMLAFAACNTDPGEVDQTVGYRDADDDSYQTGERGNVQVSEILWSGSVLNDGTWDQSDVFIEFRNEGTRPIRLDGWHVILEGTIEKTWRLPNGGPEIPVGGHVFYAAKTSGCFSEPDGLIEGLVLPHNDPFRITLRDADEHLINSSGSREMPPFAGGYDLVDSRSMEKIELMFGGRGSEPHSFHHYTRAAVDIPNNNRVDEDCRDHTLASPGHANSPDYSGAYASGGFE